MTNDITTTDKKPPVMADQSAATFGLLAKAVEQGADPANIEKLLDLQERVQAREAQAQLNNALAEFQAQCPAIVKDKEVRDRAGKILYRFAPLESVVSQVRPQLASLGLSFAFDTDQTDKGIDVWCSIHHRGGGATRSHVFVPATKGHNTNAAQETGLAATYGKRYALINALGIVTADEDLDGAAQAQKQPITMLQVETLETLIKKANADRKKFLKYLGVDAMQDVTADLYDHAVKALNAKIEQAS